MGNIQQTLDALQPYVIGIRYLNGIPIIDVVFKDKWLVPQIPNITTTKGDDNLNYHMVYSEVENVGLDDLLAYVDSVIKLNQEREKKHELLKNKIEELKSLFNNNSLDKLLDLQFSFKEEDLTPSIDELKTEEIKYDTNIISSASTSTISLFETEEPQTNQTEILTEEEREMEEEEARAERYRQYKEKSKSYDNIKKSTKVELPPKKKIQTTIDDDEIECDCSDDEACSKCINNK